MSGKNGNGKRPAKRKTTAETAGIPKIPQPHGGALNAGGTPGNAGGGRPPKIWKNFLAELRDDPQVQQALESAARNAESRNFKAALDVIVRYDEDKPAEEIRLTHEQREQRLNDLLMAAKTRKQRQVQH